MGQAVIYVQRRALSSQTIPARNADRDATLATDLADRQTKLNAAVATTTPEATGKLVDAHWNTFKASDNKRYKKKAPSIEGVLQAMFSGRCAYCEGPASEIEHFWPKAKTPENANRGTHARTFEWANLVWSCGVCNGPQHKGEKMEWTVAGAPKLLDPTKPADDPYEFFNVSLRHDPAIALGWVDPRPELDEGAAERALYTLSLLKLNERDECRRGRRTAIEHFYIVVGAIVEKGPDHLTKTNRKAREVLRDLLEAGYLGAIRQLLLDSPDLRNSIVAAMPELAVLMGFFARPPRLPAQ
jgi:uncharacterized protein (TIGR02646 family)